MSHKTASPQQTDGSIVFARWRQWALPCGHSGTIWQIWLNLCFLQPIQVNNPNGKSIGSAVFAKPTAQCRRVRWRHLANTIALVLPSAHPGPQLKRQINQFGCFCTAHGKSSLYFTMGDPLPQNCPFSWGSGPHLTQFLGSIRTYHPNGISIGRFCCFCTDDRRVSLYFTIGCPFPPQNCPFPWGIWTHLIHGSLGHPSPQLKLHLNRFSHLCRAHRCDRPTDRPLFNSHLFVETARIL